MPSVDLTVGEDDFAIQFNLINESTGGPFDLTDFNDIRLFMKTTNYVTTIVPGGVIVLPLGNPQDGSLLWNVQSTQIPNPAGQYYGQFVLTDTVTGEIRKSRQFDVRVSRSLG